MRILDIVYFATSSYWVLWSIPPCAHEPLLCTHEPLLCAHEPLLCAHEPLLGAHEPLLGAHEPLLGAHEPLLGAHEPLLGAMNHLRSPKMGKIVNILLIFWICMRAQNLRLYGWHRCTLLIQQRSHCVSLHCSASHRNVYALYALYALYSYNALYAL